MGIKKKLQDSQQLFLKFSRVPIEGMPLSSLFQVSVGKFYSFYRNYKEKPTADYNYADVEMPLKFLNFYLKEKGVL